MKDNGYKKVDVTTLLEELSHSYDFRQGTLSAYYNRRYKYAYNNIAYERGRMFGLFIRLHRFPKPCWLDSYMDANTYDMLLLAFVKGYII